MVHMAIFSAPEVAADRLGGLGQRWSHVQGVGRLAEALAAHGLVSAEVLAAAWLHDVGYAPSVAQTGFHPLDGARLLQEQGISPGMVALVAHHTGAVLEAEERGLAEELATLPPQIAGTSTHLRSSTWSWARPRESARETASHREQPPDSPAVVLVSTSPVTAGRAWRPSGR